MAQEKTYTYKYPRPAVTTDSVIFGFDEGELKILLIERGADPYKGYWSLPGGFIEETEDAETCARRELKEETGLENIFMEQLYTFSAVDRDPRYRVITIAYFALVKLADYTLHAGDDAQKAQWFPLSQLPSLCFDHPTILQMAIQRLQGKIRYQPIGFELLPEVFKIPDLHRLYETVLQAKLDRRNFRKKFLSMGLLVDRTTELKGKEHKGAKLYSFDKQTYEELANSGFYFEL